MFPSSFLQNILVQYYGYKIHLSADKLDGEVDFNYKVTATNGEKYLLKICRSDVSLEYIDFQVAVLEHLHLNSFALETPQVMPALDGSKYVEVEYDSVNYIVRIHSWVGGRMLDEVNPRSRDLLHSWGRTCGSLSNALKGFNHPSAHRYDKWNPVNFHDTKNLRKYLLDKDKLGLAQYMWKLWDEDVDNLIRKLDCSVNYSDAHEHNLLLREESKEVTGVIDFGDAVFGPTVCELAIACAYAGMHKPDPLDAMAVVVEGYHSLHPLKEIEVEALFPLICSRLMISASSAAESISKKPSNEYLQISAEPAWELLRKLRNISPQFAQYYFRSACGWIAHPKYFEFRSWLGTKEYFEPIKTIGRKVIPLDLSVGSLSLGGNRNFEDLNLFTRKIAALLEDANADLGIGGYGEVRPFYTTNAYTNEGNSGARWRTMHLGEDYWINAGEEVCSFYKGRIHSIKDNGQNCDYGPTIIVRHELPDGFEFYSLYGHLSKSSLGRVNVGDSVESGQIIGNVGEPKENGGWPPHLHFQIMLDVLNYKGDFPGAAFVNEAKVWLALCPSLYNEQNNIEGLLKDEKSNLLERRKSNLGPSLSVSYDNPLHIVRGARQFLYDAYGRRFLDTVNNVAHVGHEHPQVVKAIQKQAEVLNTNSRYLHSNITKYAETLLSKCPDKMQVVYFVNSGSEANELAIRMAKVYSGQQDMIALEVGYHGNTGSTIDVSSYKFDGKGGQGTPSNTTILPLPDCYRGQYRDREKAGLQYAKYAAEAIDSLKERDCNVAGFIAESIMSCGGQIVLPPNYLTEIYRHIHQEGGLCIADEVQVGFGRVGESYWGFELSGVVPDIITCGKPIGNGHPLGVVITTREVADAFSNGMEYFNTYGGNPVSCAAGLSVLDIIEKEKLQTNALEVGSFLKDELLKLKEEFPIVGDIRGKGFFLGIELVTCRQTLEPAKEQAKYLINRMRENAILMSTDGPYENVLKIKPPMCFTFKDAEHLVARLRQILKEDFMKVSP